MNITFDTSGMAFALWGEEIDLRILGKIRVRRATEILWNESSQEWEVHRSPGGELLHSNPSREACVLWEKQNL